jgi:hypothetical protein
VGAAGRRTCPMCRDDVGPQPPPPPRDAPLAARLKLGSHRLLNQLLAQHQERGGAAATARAGSRDRAKLPPRPSAGERVR